MPTVPPVQIPSVYHHRVGDIQVTALSDGTLERSLELLRSVTVGDAQKLLSDAFRPGVVISVNAFVLRNNGRTILVETGSGKYLGDSAGHLLSNMGAAGISPLSVDTILLTHMHPDHSAGLTDMTTGKAHFPNAELVVHENEPRHWNDDAAMARGTERQKLLFFQQARDQMAPYRDRMRTFRQGEVVPGVTVIPCHGHTPGHSAYLVSSGGQQLLIWGDMVHIPEVQIPRPEVTIDFDSDPQAAAASRKRIFDMAASDRLLVTGMHLHFPGFGHLSRDGNGYRFHPQAWQQTL
jgi:glyoxylase-like metal-dependent hydrolase (beta-lactamase superfamily II)